MDIITLKLMKIEQSIDICNARAYVKRKSNHSWCLNDRHNAYRNRWGTAKQILQDIEHFETFGNLPESKHPVF